MFVSSHVLVDVFGSEEFLVCNYTTTVIEICKYFEVIPCNEGMRDAPRPHLFSNLCISKTLHDKYSYIHSLKAITHTQLHE